MSNNEYSEQKLIQYCQFVTEFASIEFCLIKLRK